MAQQAMVQIMASDSTTQQAKEKAAEAANRLMELRELIKERVDMSKPQCVHNFLDCSTSHITLRDMEILMEWADREDRAKPSPYTTVGYTYGIFLQVRPDGAADGSDDNERQEYENEARAQDMSEAFFKLQAYARKHQCWWINLDADADTIEGLETFEW